MELKIGIIDDEKHAIETLVYDLKELFGEKIEVLFTTNNPVEGIKFTREKNVDAIFLDMDMPRLSGLDVLELINDINVKVIITTAFEQYAVKSVGTKAVAYLLKPVEPDVLKSTVEKIIPDTNPQFGNNLSGKLSVPVFDGFEIITIKEIVFCKSDNNYSEIVLESGKKIVVSKLLKLMESLLPPGQFLRIHKSYLVNVNHIKKYSKGDGGEILVSGGHNLPVSRNQREKVLKLIQNNSS